MHKYVMEELEISRNLLYKVIAEKGSLTDTDVVNASQNLDRIIIKLQIMKTNL